MVLQETARMFRHRGPCYYRFQEHLESQRLITYWECFVRGPELKMYTSFPVHTLTCLNSLMAANRWTCWSPLVVFDHLGAKTIIKNSITLYKPDSMVIERSWFEQKCEQFAGRRFLLMPFFKFGR